jgi:hypothetical protein
VERSAAHALSMRETFGWQPLLPVGFPFVINKRLWLLALILVGNATVVVSKRLYR